MKKYVSIGKCPRCGAEIIRREGVTMGLCYYHNPPIEVPLGKTFRIKISINLYEDMLNMVKQIIQKRRGKVRNAHDFNDQKFAELINSVTISQVIRDGLQLLIEKDGGEKNARI